MQIVPFVARLEQQLHSIEQQVIELLNASTIEQVPHHSYSPFYEPQVIALINDYTWGDDNGSQKYLQLKILRSYASWFERFQMLFHDSPEEIQRQIRDTHQNIKEWIEKKDGWNVPSTIDEAKRIFREELQSYYLLLQVFQTSNNADIILVPDTNALIKAPDVSSYRTVVEQDTYTGGFNSEVQHLRLYT